jgi:hypothetical protein
MVGLEYVRQSGAELQGRRNEKISVKLKDYTLYFLIALQTFTSSLPHPFLE